MRLRSAGVHAQWSNAAPWPVPKGEMLLQMQYGKLGAERPK